MRTSQVMASRTGTIRGTAHASNRPKRRRRPGLPCRSTVTWGPGMEGIGLTAARRHDLVAVGYAAENAACAVRGKTLGRDLVVVLRTPKPGRGEPLADFNAFDRPNGHKGTGQLRIQLAEHGSPSPAGQPVTRVSTIPPTESPRRRQSSRHSFIRTAAAGSGQQRGFSKAESGSRHSARTPPISRV